MDVGTVYLVGAGPGDPELLTRKAWRLLLAADVVVYDALISEALFAELPDSVQRIYAGKRGYCVGSTVQDSINELLVKLARDGRQVVRLKGGDPTLFGRGGEEAEFLARHGVPFQFVPGVTSASGAAAAANIPLTHRDIAQAVTFLTGHYDPDSPECTHDWSALAKIGPLVIYMGMRHLGKILARLCDAGLDPTTPAMLIERATLPEMRIVEATAATLAGCAIASKIQAPAIVFVGAAVECRKLWAELHSVASVRPHV